MIKHITYIIFVLVITLLSSCEKVIDIKVDDEVGRLVIEAQINNISTAQEVKISRNIALSSTGTPTAVSSAFVAVRDEANKEYVFTETKAGTYVAEGFTGIPGKNYKLEVRVDNQDYRAQAQMPQVVPLDSIAIENSKFGEKEKKNIKIFYKDPADQENYYRFIVFVNNKQTKDIIVADDKFNNGNAISLTIRPDEDDDDKKIVVGDDVRVEMQCIDKAMHKYWLTLLQQSYGGGVTPSNPPNNITPTVLGYFSVYTTTSKSIVVK